MIKKIVCGVFVCLLVLGTNAWANDSKITGKVTGPDCITPLEGIQVAAWTRESGYRHGWGAVTVADGTYEIGELPAGTYKVSFYEYDGNYFSQYYDNQADLDSAQEIVVGAGETVRDINACLEIASKITGTVTGPDCITPLEGIVACPGLVGDGSGAWVCAYTATDGTYEIGGLEARSYTVQFFDHDKYYATEYYDDQINRDSADEIVVGVEDTVSDINACLEIAAKITGTVTGPDCTTPLEGITVCPRTVDGAVGGICVQTAADGTYERDELQPGTYKVLFQYLDSNYKWVQEWYYNQTKEKDAQEIIVGPGETASDINACLTQIPTECKVDENCDSGKKCDDGQCVECLVGGDCPDDNLYCSGTPVCAGGECGFAGDPCDARQTCDETLDTCMTALPCTNDADCDEGFCLDSVCVECLVDGDCDEGLCSDNVCVECAVDDDCTEGVCAGNVCVELPDLSDSLQTYMSTLDESEKEYKLLSKAKKALDAYLAASDSLDEKALLSLDKVAASYSRDKKALSNLCKVPKYIEKAGVSVPSKIAIAGLALVLRILEDIAEDIDAEINALYASLDEAGAAKLLKKHDAANLALSAYYDAKDTGSLTAPKLAKLALKAIKKYTAALALGLKLS